MKIKESVVDGIAVLTISGKMMGGPDQHGCHERVKVEWLNSSGLGTLIGCMTSCRNSGGEMVVARAARKVNSLFMLTQVIKVFDTFDTVEEAVDHLRGLRDPRV